MSRADTDHVKTSRTRQARNIPIHPSDPQDSKKRVDDSDKPRQSYFFAIDK